MDYSEKGSKIHLLRGRRSLDFEINENGDHAVHELAQLERGVSKLPPFVFILCSIMANFMPDVYAIIASIRT